MLARVGCPPLPFFLRHKNSSPPLATRASQPSPRSDAVVSWLQFLNASGASGEGVSPALLGVSATVGAGASFSVASGAVDPLRGGLLNDSDDSAELAVVAACERPAALAVAGA